MISSDGSLPPPPRLPMVDSADGLERLRDEVRAAQPAAKLILCVDRRPDSRLAHVVIAIAANSPWFDLLPAEQTVELIQHERQRT